MVSVRANDTDYERALEILDAEGAVNLDEREANWRSEGWEGYQAQMPPAPVSGIPLRAVWSRELQFRPPRTLPLPLRQPRLKPRRGLRDKKRRSLSMRSSCGSVSATSITVVYGFAVTWSKRPLASRSTCGMKAFRLSESRWHRPVAAGDAAFQDRIIEAEEHAEEAVVGKEARVKEVVTLKKTAKDRTQTVTDKVRSTKVDVEDEEDLKGCGDVASLKAA